jgi:hypothetical protein
MVKSKKSKAKLKANSSKASSALSSTLSQPKENLDTLDWLREAHDALYQLEYHDEDELIIKMKRFLQESTATNTVIQDLYQLWQETVLKSLLASATLWKQERVQAVEQRTLKEDMKTARYKIHFIVHQVWGNMLTNPHKWDRQHVLQACLQTLHLVVRLITSCPFSETCIRQAITHFETKEFLAAVACETWDTLYDYSIPIDAERFIPVLRRCAMTDILDKDWNMLGGWDDVLKGIETKCCSAPVARLPCDALLHERTTILRNARNSLQCKFFSVRFLRYTPDQAPQRWRYFPKCAAPACANIETRMQPHARRCRVCWYFHYCCAACEEYCDSIVGLHSKFCVDTPANKAALCRQETELYLGWASSDTNDKGLSCHACGMKQEHDAGDDGMKRCSKCQSVYYCSRQCQEWDWKIGGHKTECGSRRKQRNQDEIPADMEDDVEPKCTCSHSSATTSTNALLP